MEKVLTFLQGKKSTIVAVLALTISFISLKGGIDNDTATYLNLVLTTLAFGANYATNKTLGAKK